MVAKFSIFVICNALLILHSNAGMDEFLRDSLYSIQSNKDDGALSLSETSQDIYKRATLEKWKNLETQKWIVRDFESTGMYEFTPLLHNTSSNIVTYQLTKNVYTYKRRWTIKILGNQRYQIKNPETGFCLTNMGLHEQVDETECDKKNPMTQIWKLRILRKD